MPRRTVHILVLGTLALCGLLASFARAQPSAAGAPAATQPDGGRPAVVITIDGQIDDYTKRSMLKRFDDARALGAKVIVLRVDTYGGLVTSAMEMSSFLKRQDDLHVIAFIDEKAISAGAMIALAADEIMMAPG